MPEKDEERLLLQSLRRFFKKSDTVSDTVGPAPCFEPFKALPSSGGVEWPSSAFEKLGSAGLDLLQGLLAWSPATRLSASEALSHAFLQRGALTASWLCSPPGTSGSSVSHRFCNSLASVVNKRHPWTMVSGVIDQAVLSWMRDDFVQGLDKLKASAQHIAPLSSGGAKYRLAGKMVEDPQSVWMNRLKIDKWLPTPRLVAWVRAFKQANSQVLSRMTAEAQQSLRALRPEDLGKNGHNFLEHDWDSWFCSAGELHIFQNAGDSFEEPHYDGGAAILLLAITVYGRRTLRVGDEASCFDQGMAPGCVYLGTMTGPSHQVLHTPSLGPEELLCDHAVVLILRTTLFPHDRSRGKKNIPTPACVFTALASSFLLSLQKETFVLPTEQQCLDSFRPV